MAILPAFFGQAPAQGDPAAGGVLGGFGQGLQNFNNTIADNRQQIMGFGMGLMGGNSVADGWQQASAGLTRGALLDASTKKEKDAQAERERRRNGLLKLAEKYGLDPAIADNPEIAGSALAQRMAPDNGTVVERNGRTFRMFRDGRVEEVSGLPAQAEAGTIKEVNGQLFRVTSAGATPISGLPAQKTDDDMLLERAGATPEEKTAYARAKAGLGGTPPKIEWQDDGSGRKVPFIVRAGGPGQDPSIKPATVEGGMPGTGMPKPTEAQRTSLGKIRTSALNLEGELNRMDELVKKYGSEQMPGPARSQMESTRTNIIMQLKNLYELGAITGPDLPLMEKMISDPTSWGSMYDTQGRISAQTAEMRRIIRSTVANTEAGITGKMPEKPADAPKAGPTLAPGQTRPFARGTLTREN